jgi:hypothetical protein
VRDADALRLKLKAVVDADSKFMDLTAFAAEQSAIDTASPQTYFCYLTNARNPAYLSSSNR